MLIDVDLPDWKQALLFAIGFSIGFFAPSTLAQVKNIIMSVGKSYASERTQTMGSLLEKNMSGVALFVVGGFLLLTGIKVLFSLAIGLILGLALRYTLWMHMGVIPEPDPVNYWNMLMGMFA